MQRVLKKYGKLCFIVLCVKSIVLEGFTLTMVNSANRESGRAASTIQRVVKSAKQLLARILNKPRALPGHDQNSEVAQSFTLPEWNWQTPDWEPLLQVPSPVSGQDSPVPRWKRDVEIDHHLRSVMMARSRDGDERVMRDSLLTPDNTLCLRVRFFKLARSQVTVTMCLYRGRPMIDIRRWEHGVLVLQLKPFVLSPHEYFGLSKQYVNICDRIRSVEIHLRYPVRDDHLVLEVDNDGSQLPLNVTIAKPSELHPAHEGGEHG